MRARSTRTARFRAALTGTLICAAVLAFAPGCKDERVLHGRDCDTRFTGDDLEGTWDLRGEGERTRCDDRRLEGRLQFETSMPVRVRARAQETTGAATGPEAQFESDAFVDRIERADFLVEREDAGELVIEGSATGSCFRVHLEEELADGDVVRYELDGWILASGQARGEFTGSGPEFCQSEGTFELDIR